MTGDFEGIPAIANAAIGTTPSGQELTFPFPEVLKVIELCTRNEIAVLGLEMFLVKSDGFYAAGCSDYHIRLTRKWPEVRAADWDEYLRENNQLAEDCVRQNPSGDDHVYVLTTASWSEFRKIQGKKGSH